MEQDKITDFTDLHAWQKGHSFVIGVYQITKTFPKEELFGLVSQMRRSAVSVTSNIAEGFGRRPLKEKQQFYGVALGSLSEIQNQLFIARDTQIMSTDRFDSLYQQSVEVRKLITGLTNGTHMKNSKRSR